MVSRTYIPRLSFGGLSPFWPIPEDRQIMVLKSYFDGANHADLSQHDRVVLATVSGSPEQWDMFFEDWNEVLGKYDVAYLHVTDALTLNKPYAIDRGWSDALVDDLIVDCVRSRYSNVGFRGCGTAITTLGTTAEFRIQFRLEQLPDQ